ncbi:MAG: hypothetical protein A2Y67_02895 [Candidatus Buchananbacteria bacterium RBG_13_39_9]|uniref:Zinc-finger domain-containing protein n=1 Tax=Candidatus Buchananbacteria bacterium RBG_13_39_9 TaxID=1797531 RepID=A0A1G1XRQ4_9BACT|nr:MAG: hypothetical protein A2Y67_02895 [Candidatus Buchananbacteria bacterium RBG_13_39_9]
MPEMVRQIFQAVFRALTSQPETIKVGDLSWVECPTALDFIKQGDLNREELKAFYGHLKSCRFCREHQAEIMEARKKTIMAH